MRVKTTRFGAVETIEIPEEDTLSFPEGLPGFEGKTRFAIIQDEQLAPFQWLQSLEDPYVGFLVVEPSVFTSDYAFDLPDAEAHALRLDESEQPLVLTILVVPGDIKKMTANLRAPLIINQRRRVAKQVILPDERQPIKYPVFGGVPAANGVGH